MNDVHTRHCLGTIGGCIAIDNAFVLASNIVAASCSSTAGGCIALDSVAAYSRLDNVEMAGGVATDKGGALLCVNSGATFGNVAISNSAAAYGGGVAAIGQGYCTLLECVVVENAAGVIGGGVYIGDDSTVNLHNCEVSSNIAGSAAGGVAIMSRGASVVFNSSVLDNKCATAGGGFSVVSTAMLTVSNSTIMRNRAVTGGAASVVANSAASFVGTVISDNVAELSGGAIDASVMGSVLNSDCEFVHNTAGLGGALSSSSGATWSVLASHFTNNQAKGRGGAVFASVGSPFRFSGSTFANNSALGDGGAVHVGASTNYDNVAAQGSANIDFARCTFLYNTAIGRGGALSIDSAGALVHIVGCSMEGNRADVGGGVAMTQVMSANMDWCNMTNNEATHGGGAWFSTNATLSNARIVHNKATGYGGGVFTGSSGTSLTHLTVMHNDARHGGGAAIVGNASVSTLHLGFNSASETGGGLYVKQTGGGGSDVATLHSITAWYNTAGMAGDGVFLGWDDGLQAFEPQRLVCIGCSWRYGKSTSGNVKSTTEGWASLPYQVLGKFDTTPFAGELFSLDVHVVDIFNNTVRQKELVATYRVNAPVLENCAARYPAFVPASRSGSTRMEGFAVFALQGSQCWLQVKSSPQHSGYPRRFNASTVISSCPEGTESRTVSSGSVKDVQCRKCDTNFYNLVPGSACAPCPNELLCFGGNDVRVKAQHYVALPDNITSNDQLQVLRCRPGFCCRSGQCDLSNPDTWCRANRTGVLCGQCSDGTVPVGASCVECDRPNWPNLLMFGFLLFLFTLGTIVFTTSRSDPFFLLLTFGYQMTSIILPTGKVEAVTNTLVAIGLEFTSWDNLMDKAGENKTCFAPFTALQGIIFDLAMPGVSLLSLVVLCGAHYFLYNRCCRGRRDCWGHWAWKWSVPRYKTATLRWVLTFYNVFSDTAVRLLHCVHVDATGKSYLVAQPSVVCGEAPQRMGMIIGILILVLWVFGMPFAMSILLWSRNRIAATKNLTLLESPTHLRQYGVLYATYKAHLFLFMPFHIVRRAIAVVVDASLMQYPIGRTTAIALVMIFFLSLHQALRPFNEDYSRYNALETAMLFGLVLLALTQMVANSQSVVAARLSGAADFVSTAQGVLIVGAFAWVVVASVLLLRAKLGGVAPAARQWTREIILRATSEGAAPQGPHTSSPASTCETMNPIGDVEMTAATRHQVPRSLLTSSAVNRKVNAHA